MSKHSPGPWYWSGDVLMSNVDSEDHWDQAIMDCPSAQWPPSDADKRLIAAAPEMLELLRRLATGCYFEADTVDPGEIDDLLKRIDNEP